MNIFFDETPGSADASYDGPRFAVEWFAVNAVEAASPTAAGEAGANQRIGGQQMQCSPKVKQIIQMIFALDNEEQEEFAQIIVQVIQQELGEHPRATIN